MNKPLLALVLLCLIIVGVGIYYEIKVDKTNWWTETLCSEEDGRLYDLTGPLSQYYKCIIDDKDYRAFFGKESRYRSNLTNSEYYIWSLEEIGDSKQVDNSQWNQMFIFCAEDMPTQYILFIGRDGAKTIVVNEICEELRTSKQGGKSDE